jgi:hypothetical protein
MQAMDYVKGISWYLKRRGFSKEVVYKIKLIGKEIDTTNSFCYLPDFMSLLEIFTYSYKFDGIFFNYNSDFKLINDGFGDVVNKKEIGKIEEVF